MTTDPRFKDASDAAIAAERVERDAWLDYFQAAPADAVDAVKLAYHRIGGMGLLAGGAIPIIELNRVMAVGIDAPTDQSELSAAVAWLDTNGAKNWAIQVSPQMRTPSLQSWLEANKLVPSGNGWAKFVRSTSPSQPDTSSHAKIDVRLAGKEAAETFGAVVQAGFGLPQVMAGWFSSLVNRPSWNTYIAYDGADAVATGAMFMADGSAWFGIDTTLPAYRGRGVQAALIAARLSDARSAGARVCTAETAYSPAPNEEGYSSYRNYLRGGFGLAYVRQNFRSEQA